MPADTAGSGVFQPTAEPGTAYAEPVTDRSTHIFIQAGKFRTPIATHSLRVRNHHEDLAKPSPGQTDVFRRAESLLFA